MRQRLARLLLSVSLTALPLGALCVALGAAAERGSRGQFGETVEVNLVNIDVVVTDRKGAPIDDLEAGDFEVISEGRPVEITNFLAVQGRADGASAPNQGTLADATSTAEPLQLVVLFDNANTRFQNRQHLLSQLGEVLQKRVGPRDRVLIASYDHGITIHRGFTSDPEEIAGGLRSLEGTAARGQENESDLDMLRKVVGYNYNGERRQSCELIGDEAISRYTYSVGHRVSSALKEIGDFVGSLGGIPGRKSLLYVSDGLELRPGAWILQAVAGQCDTSATLRANGYDLALRMKKLTSIANTARVTLYPLDAAGGRTPPSMITDGSFGDFEKTSGLTDSLVFLAADTGGKALLKAVDLDQALRPVLTDAANYYSLGFAAPTRSLGELRSIEVKVKRRGAELRYRHGYQDRSETERLTDRLLAAVWLGQGDNPLEVRMEAAGASLSVAEGYQVPLRIGVPLRNLQLRPEGDQLVGRLTVFVTAAGADGSLASVATDTVPVSVRVDALDSSREKLFGYEIQLIMKPGGQRVAIGVRDDLARVSSVIVHDIQVGPRNP